MENSKPVVGSSVPEETTVRRTATISGPTFPLLPYGPRPTYTRQDAESSYTRQDATVEERRKVKRDKEVKHLLAFQRVMARKGKLEQNIMQCLFVGYPRGGKSSLIRRLIGQPPTPSLPSTGVAEKVIQVEVCKITTSAVMVSPDEIKHSLWRILNFTDEAIALVAVSSRQNEKATKEVSAKVKGIKPVEMEISDESVILGKDVPLRRSLSDLDVRKMPTLRSYMQTLHSNPVVDISALFTSAPMKLLSDAMKQEGLEELQKYLDKSLTLYLTDTGGQIEFQELLPALVSGHFIIFLVFRLDQDLNETFTVNYLHPDGQSAQPYQSSFTTIDTLLQSLASIASMGTYMHTDIQQPMSTKPMRPKVVFVGTHKDKVSPEQVEQIDSQLQQVIKKTAAYRNGLIEYASENRSKTASQTRLVLAVNNLSPKGSEFNVIRSVVERISSRGDFKVIAPSTWLIFSLFLRQLGKRVITYDECMYHAHSCGIDSSEELNEALWFLHRKLGLIRYFHGEGLGDLQNIVIIDPQILFDKITKLITETFTFKKVSSIMYDEFKEKGIFSLSTLTEVSSEDEDELLTLDIFIKLLEHLHVIAHLHGEEKFFMPCALVHVTSTAPVSVQPFTQLQPLSGPVLASCSSLPSQVQPPPLLVTFKCGYTPKGVFGAMSVYLLANKMKSSFTWELQTDKIFRNSISLSVTPFDTVTLRVEPTHLEVSVIPAETEVDRAFPIEETCMEVKQCIEVAVEEVTSSLGYTRDVEHTLTFYCTRDHKASQNKHPGVIKYYKNKPCSMSCDFHEKCVSQLPPGYQLWFNEISMRPTDKSDQHLLKTLEQLEMVDRGGERRDAKEEGDRALSQEDFVNITDYLLALEPEKIYNLGVVLGLDQLMLKRMQLSHSFLDDVVSLWLRRDCNVEKFGAPSWRTLARALRHERLKLNGLANKISEDKDFSI